MAARLCACASEGSTWPAVGSHGHGPLRREALPGGAASEGGAAVARRRPSNAADATTYAAVLWGVRAARSSGVAAGHRVPRAGSRLHRFVGSACVCLRPKRQEPGRREKRTKAASYLPRITRLTDQVKGTAAQCSQPAVLEDVLHRGHQWRIHETICSI